MESFYQNIGNGIVFPEFNGKFLYMHKTPMDNIILPDGFGDYTQVIEGILNKIKDKNNVCYVTIDEKTVCNDTHRRAGMHVDFNWFENMGGGGHGHKKTMTMGNWDGGGNGGSGDWRGTPVADPVIPIKPNGNHSGSPPATHCSIAEFNKNGGMILVSNYPGCKVYKGKFSGEIGQGGDCSNIDVSHLKSEIMKPGHAYFINALGIHEPLVIKEKVNRSLIRINLHPEYVWNN